MCLCSALSARSATINVLEEVVAKARMVYIPVVLTAPAHCLSVCRLYVCSAALPCCSGTIDEVEEVVTKAPIFLRYPFSCCWLLLLLLTADLYIFVTLLTSVCLLCCSAMLQRHH